MRITFLVGFSTDFSGSRLGVGPWSNKNLRAKYMEENHPGTAISPDYWIRLKSACTPDESQQTWAEALLCLEAIDETLRDSKTLQ